MPPRRFSRHTFTRGVRDSSDRLYLTEREPFRYKFLGDTRTHKVSKGDTLFTLADRYFPSFDRGAGLWWVIADFQPNPIIDPTVDLALGAIVHIPSERVVAEEVFNEKRRSEEPV